MEASAAAQRANQERLEALVTEMEDKLSASAAAHDAEKERLEASAAAQRANQERLEALVTEIGDRLSTSAAAHDAEVEATAEVQHANQVRLETLVKEMAISGSASAAAHDAEKKRIEASARAEQERLDHALLLRRTPRSMKSPRGEQALRLLLPVTDIHEMCSNCSDDMSSEYIYVSWHRL